MRLKHIKLAGFKSFVDPTIVSVPSNLIGVVGPNGCGKSNIIDAVRWVMGEMSAKNLRGENMADVIFSGSNARKPVGKAFVELVFDNSEGKAPGPYAQYAEIAVRRAVSRDGTSDYLINKTKCRRKDITDLFLGTGLGPRSISVIEQGMVTRIIEGKPDDLRAFVEEAAGIARYKDRRRDTENRIRHTRENLERVEDIRSELESQLRRLHRQSRAAARFKELKQEERIIHAQLLALRWKDLGAQINNEDATLAKLEKQLEAQRAAQREIETRIEDLRQKRTAGTDHFNTAQAAFYSIGAEIASVEQAIEHAKETYQQRLREQGDLSKALAQASQHLEEDQTRVQELDNNIVETDTQLEERSREAERTAAQRSEVEASMQQWQEAWNEFTHRFAQSGKQKDVQDARIQQFGETVARIKDRQVRLNEEFMTVDRELAGLDVAALRDEVGKFERACTVGESAITEIEDKLRATRKEIDEVAAVLEESVGNKQAIDGRLGSLQELQAASRGEQNEALVGWFNDRGLDRAPRLTEQLTVADGWEKAVDRVLGTALGAVCVDSVQAMVADVAALGGADLFLVERGATHAAPGTSTRPMLLDKVGANSVDMSTLLADVFIAETLEMAISMRPGLDGRDVVVTRDGTLVGKNWISLLDQEGAKAGMLERTREIERLTGESGALAEEISELRARLERSQEVRDSLELDHNEERKRLAQVTEERGAAQSLLAGAESRSAQFESRRGQIQAELDELLRHLDQDQRDLGTSQQLLQAAQSDVANLDDERERLQVQRNELSQRLDEARRAAGVARDAKHALELRRQELQTALDSTRESLGRLDGQIKGLATRRTELEQALAQGTKPEEDLKLRLDGLLQKRVDAEMNLGGARETVTNLEAEIGDQEQQRVGREQQVEEIRELVEQARVARKELSVRGETLEEQIRELNADVHEVLAELPEEASEDVWHEQLESIERKITRIGPVNLVAIEEYEEQSERKKYLDQQFEDLSKAMAMLEDAIRKIDRETRTRFKETFDRINTGFQTFFPQLFGGGHATLELVGDDLLNAGVTVMARPPGKRNTTIHLLSGGEKALTAISLMFAFFDLNPAPFCLLDEVDAPLDDANVERYCDTIRKLGEKSQMIFITHNKISMEAADILIGVTMSEPGVSALVQVDVGQAVELAAQ